MDADLSPELEVLADLESAMDRAHKVFGEGLWRLPEDEVRESLTRLHRLNAQGASLQLTVTRQVDVRAIPATLGR